MTLNERAVAQRMQKLYEDSNEHIFIEAFLAVMVLHGARVRMNITWPYKRAVTKAAKKTAAKKPTKKGETQR